MAAVYLSLVSISMILGIFLLNDFRVRDPGNPGGAPNRSQEPEIQASPDTDLTGEEQDVLDDDIDTGEEQKVLDGQSIVENNSSRENKK